MEQAFPSSRPMLGVAGELRATSGRREIRIVGHGAVVEVHLNFLPWRWRRLDPRQLPPPLDRFAVTWWLHAGCRLRILVHGGHVASCTPAGENMLRTRFHWIGVAKALIHSLVR